MFGKFCRGCFRSGLMAVLALCRAAGAGDIPRFISNPPQRSSAEAGSRAHGGAYDLSSLPLYFEKDPTRDRFQTRTADAQLLFDAGGFWLGVGHSGTSVRVNFQGAREAAQPAGQGPLAAYTNYFTGNDPNQWSSRQHFSSVRYDSLWPGVNAVFYPRQNLLEYDFDVAPQADPSRIRLRVDGAEAMTLDEQGDLWIATRSGKSRQRRPALYQEIDGRRVEVAGGYRITENNQVAFWVGNYDHARKLVIDPVLQFSTYLGGSG